MRHWKPHRDVSNKNTFHFFGEEATARPRKRQIFAELSAQRDPDLESEMKI